MRRKKIETMFLVTHEIRQVFHVYAICGFWILEFELSLNLFWFIWHMLAVQVQTVTPGRTVGFNVLINRELQYRHF